MKKLLLGALLLLSTLSFGQPKKLDTLSVTSKTLNWFKNSYVQEHFKDPYSYQLMGHRTQVISMKEWLQKDLDFCDEFIEKYNNSDTHSKFDKEMFIKFSDDRVKIDERVKNIKEDYIKTYYIYVDAHGSNSYGNVILTRYRVMLDISNNFQIPVSVEKY